jgi:hydroxyacylglutathione hydrolase
MKVKTFLFNDFQENTYLLIDDISKECIIVDPGCNGTAENQLFSSYIENNNLIPVRLVNTHCHIDHILGNAFVASKYNLPLEAHAGEIPVLDRGQMTATMYGIPYVQSPSIASFLDESQVIKFGSYELSILLCPGHSPASICFYEKQSNKLIAGDVLFNGSIGRTDLPGGDYDTLINSITEKLWPLPDETIVYPGHGIPTTIGEEKQHNPFFNN